MNATRTAIIGDSHVDAIKGALTLASSQASSEPQAQAFRIARVKNDVLIGDLAFKDFLSQAALLDANDLVVSAIGGNQHSVFGLVQHPRVFDFHSLELPELPLLPGCEVIPYRVLWDQFESGLRGRDGERLQALAQATRARLLHLAPPPPKEDAAHILRRHETDFAKAGILENGVTPAPVRLKLWALQLAVLRNLLPTWKFELVPPPPGSQTALGYLKPEYYADDATHANASYGALVLAQLRGFAAPVSEHGR